MRIFGIGSTVVDHLVEVPSYPQRDSKTKIVRQRMQVGGPVPTALSTAAFYGAGTTLLSRWGADEAGRYISSALNSRGVDISLCETQTSWQSGFAHVWISAEDGSRTLAAFPGEFPALVLNDAARREIGTCKLLHLDGSSPDAAIEAASLMKSQGGTVVLDAGSVKPRFDELLPMVDVLVASVLFRKSRFGRKKAERSDLLALGPSVVIATNGDQGATCYFEGGELNAPAIDVSVVDTNGAGDIFSGAILVGLSRKWAREKTIRFANSVAGFACEVYGNDSLRAEKEILTV